MVELLTLENLEKVKLVGIFGALGSGKTAFAFRCLEVLEQGNREICVLNHPKPELVKQLGYTPITFSELERAQNCVVYWDEVNLNQEGMSDFKRDELLVKYLALLRQRNNLLILSTSNTRLFTPKVESYIDLWIVMDCEYRSVKRGGKVSRVINANIINPFAFTLQVGEYCSDSRILKQMNGVHTFEPASKWSEELSKPFHISKMSQGGVMGQSIGSKNSSELKLQQKVEKEVTIATVAGNPKPDNRQTENVEDSLGAGV